MARSPPNRKSCRISGGAAVSTATRGGGARPDGATTVNISASPGGSPAAAATRGPPDTPSVTVPSPGHSMTRPTTPPGAGAVACDAPPSSLPSCPAAGASPPRSQPSVKWGSCIWLGGATSSSSSSRSTCSCVGTNQSWEDASGRLRHEPATERPSAAASKAAASAPKRSSSSPAPRGAAAAAAGAAAAWPSNSSRSSGAAVAASSNCSASRWVSRSAARRRVRTRPPPPSIAETMRKMPCTACGCCPP